MRAQNAAQGRVLSRAVTVATIVWVVTDLLIWIVIIVLGLIQGTIPPATGFGKENFYVAAPGYPAFHIPLAVYIVLALVWLAFSILTIRPQRRGGFFQPSFLLAQNIVFGIGDFIIAESFEGNPDWPHLAWIACVIRGVGAIINVVSIVRGRRGRRA